MKRNSDAVDFETAATVWVPTLPTRKLSRPTRQPVAAFLQPHFLTLYWFRYSGFSVFEDFALALKSNLIPEPALLLVPDDAGMLSWRDIFLNDHPVQLEIGSGKGTFLLGAATEFPNHNFIGIEWARAYCDFAADRIRRHQLLNARMVRADANWWIRAHVPDQSLHALHVYFPDPWPKARHHKRRLIQTPFLLQALRILVPGGVLRIVTDHAGYFEHIRTVCSEFKALHVIDFVPPLPTADGLLVGTNFEKKYILQNRSFNSIALKKPE